MLPFFYPQRIYPVYHVIGISYLINHVITILIPYFGFTAYQWRPQFLGFIKAYGYFLVYFTFVYFLNPLIDGNYFYLKYRPFFQDWPEYIYVPCLLLVVLIGFYFAYLIVNFIERMPSRQKEMENKRLDA